jgi:hypothetical protein
MPPKKETQAKGKAKMAAGGGEEDAKMQEVKPVKETGAQIVRNLLEQGRISTPHPNNPFLKWPEWTCLHCNETYYPAQNYEQTEKRDSDITSPITKHFDKRHGNGPDSAYAQAAPNIYKLRIARHSEDGEVLVPAKVRRAFASHARGLWNHVRAPSFGPLPSALRGAPVCPACPPLTCLCTYPGQLTNEYEVEPTQALLCQIGLLWAKGFLAVKDEDTPEDKIARVKLLREELETTIAKHHG